MGKIIFQLLSCLYLYDSGMPVPVSCRKQSRYTGVRRLALTYRSTGIPASDATGKFAQVYRRSTPQGSLRKAGKPASDVLRVKKHIMHSYIQCKYTNFRPDNNLRLYSISPILQTKFTTNKV